MSASNLRGVAAFSGRLSWRFTLVACTALSTMAGCAAPTLSAEPTGDGSEAIMGGYNDGGDPAVVAISTWGGALCSGSLIAPNLVLTARHCVSSVLNEKNGGVLCGTTTFAPLNWAESFFVTTKETLSWKKSDYVTVKEVIPLPVDTDAFCGNDMALLLLTANIDPAVKPLVPRVDEPLVAQEEYVAVGYGMTDPAVPESSGVRRRRDGLFIDCVGKDCSHKFHNAESEWVGDQGICQGDSGGPAIDMKGRVVGVTSRGAQQCDDPIYGYVLSWATWLKDNAKYAAAQGGYEPPSWANGFPTDPIYSAPLGGACSAPEDCLTGVCIVDKEGSYCSRGCSDIAPCPDGFTCDPTSVVCIQDAKPEPTGDEEGGSQKALSASPGDAEDGACAFGPRGTPAPGALLFAIAVGFGLRRRPRSIG